MGPFNGHDFVILKITFEGKLMKNHEAAPNTGKI